MPGVLRDDPYPSFNFLIEIEGISDDGRAVRGAFSEVSGLEAEVSIIEYRNGNEDITVRKLPGLKKFPNIVLKRGLIGDETLWKWIRTALDGKVKRADGAIILLDESRQEVMRWCFRRGWPCKWTGPTLGAKNNEVAMETLEICHEGLELDE